MTDQLHTAEYWRRAPREEVERFAGGLVTPDYYVIGLAKAELVERDQEYAAEREADRRVWEEAREQSRRDFEAKRFELEGRRLDEQRDHEIHLAEYQAGAAREAAELQATATRESASRQSRAAWAAAFAAFAAALAAIVSLAVTIYTPPHTERTPTPLIPPAASAGQH
jgi:hypothetical protein